MRNAAEWIGLHHIKHCVDNFFSKNCRENLLVLDIRRFLECNKQGSKKFNGTNSMNSNFLNLTIALVNVAVEVRLAKDDDAIICHISEVKSKCLLNLLFSFFSNLFLCVKVLTNDCCQ